MQSFPRYCSKTEIGQILVNSLFTLSLAVGISVNDTTLGTTGANLGFGKVSFPAPVFIGDTLTVQTIVFLATAGAAYSSWL